MRAYRPLTTILAFLLVFSLGWTALAQNETVTLRVATWIDRNTPSNEGAWAEVMEEWEKRYPHIKIDLLMIPYNEYFNKLAVLLVTGDIDVFDISDSRIAQYTRSGSLLDLTHYIERDLNLDDYYLTSLERGRFPHTEEGRMYSIWTFMSPAVMYINRDLFNNAGLIIPEGWTYDLMEIIGSKLLKDVNGDGVPDQFGFGPGFGTFAGRRGYGMGSLLRAFGANDYTPDGKRYQLDTPEHLAAYEFAYSFVERGITQLGVGSAQFRQGSVGLHFDGTWVAPQLAQQAQFTWGMVPPPAGPAGPKVILHGNPSLAISAYTPVPEAAWTFVRHILETQTATNIYLSGNMPTKRAAAAEWIAAGEQLWPGFDAQAAIASVENSVFLPVISPHDPAAESAITSVLQKAARGEMPFSVALEEATRQANAIIGQ